MLGFLGTVAGMIAAFYPAQRAAKRAVDKHNCGYRYPNCSNYNRIWFDSGNSSSIF